jgi:HK97 family phage major capsid protein
MANKDTLVSKVDIALSNLTASGGTGGGILLPEQSDAFIQSMMDEPTILKECRFQPMKSPKMNINKVAFNSRILTAASETGGQQDSGANTRWVPAANRAAPQLSQIELSVQEVIAEIRLPYEVLEDNVESQGFANTLVAMIAKAAARDIEELIINGDTTSADPYLALVDGVLKLSTANVVDNAESTLVTRTFGKLKKSIPTRFQGNIDQFHWYLHHSLETDYRMQIAGQVVTESAWTLGAAVLSPLGNPISKTAKMPTSSVLYTHPKNIVVGWHREIRIEQAREIRSREIVIVLTARLDVAVEEPLAIAQAKNVALSA